MKLVYIAPYPIPSIYANSVQVMKMCAAFAGVGHAVTLIAPSYGKSVVGAEEIQARYGLRASFDIELVAIGERRGSPHWYAWRAAARAAARNPQIVYSRLATACLGAALRGFDTICEVHQPVTGFVARWAFRSLWRHPRCRRVVCISQCLARHYEETWGMPASMLQVAHDGADLPDNPPAESGPGQEPLQVGFVGQLYEGHGIALILDLAASLPKLDFHIVGGSAGAVEAWRARARSPNIHFHGYVPHGEMPAWYRRFDMVLAPYREHVVVAGGSDKSRWMSPLKIFEYMAAGKSVLCSDLPVLREVLEDRRTALLLPPEDPSAWTRALAELGRDPDLRDRLGAAARQCVREKYTWSARATKVLALAGGSGRPAAP